LGRIPTDFIDDGCTNSPDGLFRVDLRWACRIHDWRYCTRCHAPGSMTAGARHRADDELRRHIDGAWKGKIIPWLYWKAVHLFGGTNAYDSCGPAAGRVCRHGQHVPMWMKDSYHRLLSANIRRWKDAIREQPKS
jgi:hypothetical protein